MGSAGGFGGLWCQKRGKAGKDGGKMNPALDLLCSLCCGESAAPHVLREKEGVTERERKNLHELRMSQCGTEGFNFNYCDPSKGGLGGDLVRDRPSKACYSLAIPDCGQIYPYECITLSSLNNAHPRLNYKSLHMVLSYHYF